MLIRVILLFSLVAIGYFVFLKRRTFPIHVVLVFAFLAVAGALVVFPRLSSELALLVGVGRGSDLVTYLVEVGLLFVAIHYFAKFVELQHQITQVAREVALLRAELERRTTGEPVSARAFPPEDGRDRRAEQPSAGGAEGERRGEHHV
jgi:small membrane protein